MCASRSLLCNRRVLRPANDIMSSVEVIRWVPPDWAGRYRKVFTSILSRTCSGWRRGYTQVDWISQPSVNSRSTSDAWTRNAIITRRVYSRWWLFLSHSWRELNDAGATMKMRVRRAFLCVALWKWTLTFAQLIPSRIIKREGEQSRRGK